MTWYWIPGGPYCLLCIPDRVLQKLASQVCQRSRQKQAPWKVFSLQTKGSLIHLIHPSHNPSFSRATWDTIFLPLLTLCKSMDCSPPGSSVRGTFSGKNTGMCCHSFLQGIFPTQGSNTGLRCRQIFLTCEPPGMPINQAVYFN